MGDGENSLGEVREEKGEKDPKYPTGEIIHGLP